MADCLYRTKANNNGQEVAVCKWCLDHVPTADPYCYEENPDNCNTYVRLTYKSNDFIANYLPRFAICILPGIGTLIGIGLTVWNFTRGTYAGRVKGTRWVIATVLAIAVWVALEANGIMSIQNYLPF